MEIKELQDKMMDLYDAAESALADENVDRQMIAEYMCEVVFALAHDRPVPRPRF